MKIGQLLNTVNDKLSQYAGGSNINVVDDKDNDISDITFDIENNNKIIFKIFRGRATLLSLNLKGDFLCSNCSERLNTDSIKKWEYCPACGVEIDSFEEKEE